MVLLFKLVNVIEEGVCFFLLYDGSFMFLIFEYLMSF